MLVVVEQALGDVERGDVVVLGLFGEGESLYPEAGFPDDRWCAEDPRVTWLEKFLKEHRGEKVLVICARRDTAIVQPGGAGGGPG